MFLKMEGPQCTYRHSLIDAVNPLTNSKRKEEACARASRFRYQKYQNSVAGMSVDLLIYFFTEYSAVHNRKNFRHPNLTPGLDSGCTMCRYTCLPKNGNDVYHIIILPSELTPLSHQRQHTHNQVMILIRRYGLLLASFSCKRMHTLWVQGSGNGILRTYQGLLHRAVILSN